MKSDAPQGHCSWYAQNATTLQAQAQPFFHHVSRLETGRMAAAAQERFQDLLPTLPYIGGEDNHLTGNLVLGAAMLCLYLVMKDQGCSAEEAGRLVYDAFMADAAGQPLPDSGMPERMRDLHQRAESFSQAYAFPFGWAAHYLEGDGKTFDWGIDYTTCGLHALFTQYGASEFLPYLCYLDLPMYQARGIGLVRTSTLAQGADRCDFRFNLRGEYRLEWTPGFLREPADQP